MRFLFYLGHPAHFHLFRVVIDRLKAGGHEVVLLIKKKDVLEELVRSQGWDYTNINPEGRADHKLAIAWKLLKRDFKVLQIARRFRPQVMAGTSAEIAHVGKLLGIPSFVFNEDDASVVPYFARLAYPLASHIVAPDCCGVGKWADKKIGYAGYHELAYLHPNHFTPDRSQIGALEKDGRPYFLLRFAQLTAHHDEGKSGISTVVARKLVETLTPHGSVFITSERPLEPEFEPYRIRIHPSKMHHAMAFASLYIGDSQTMAAEAAVLGVPSVRFNDFVGKIGYLQDLEERGLSVGIPSTQPERLLTAVSQMLIDLPGIRAAWSRNQEAMLREKIDCAAFFERILLAGGSF